MSDSNFNLNIESMRRIYRLISYAGIPMYFGYAVILWLANKIELTAVFLLFSVICMLYLIPKKVPFKIMVPNVHIKVILGTILFVSSMGWDYGFQHILLGTAVLSFVSPFKNQVIPLITSVVEIGLYGALYFIYGNIAPCYIFPEHIIDMIFILNTFLAMSMPVMVGLRINSTSSMLYEQLANERSKFKNLADYDALTGLLMRRPMITMMESFWNQWVNDKDNFYLVISDLDNFKRINDEFGHEAGDIILKAVGEILRENVRENDYVARWGGDEFMFLLSKIKSKDVAVDLLDRIREAVKLSEFEYKGYKHKVSMTFGAVSANNAKSIDDMKVLADKALYKGKNEGGNSVSIFMPE